MIGKTITLLLLLNLLSGCGAVVRHVESSWPDDQTVYDKSQPMPLLEISPELTSEAQKNHQ